MLGQMLIGHMFNFYLKLEDEFEFFAKILDVIQYRIVIQGINLKGYIILWGKGT